MNTLNRDRRQFMQSVCGAAAGCLFASSVRASEDAVPPASGNWIRLGAPIFDAPGDPESLALAHRQLGYRAA